ncbi:MAG: bifunctional UDP-N-acetylglucosamine diphosphorylase/glucosamine-1-phosphate N-acetyltransferase GlmU [Halocynthiibacter sp.]
MATSLIILAAGQGSRMKSDLPKVLHKVAGAPLLVHAMESGASLDPERIVVVAGVGADLVEAAAITHRDDVVTVRQDEQLGTAHAVDQAKEALSDLSGPAIVLYGDTPFIKPETLENMIEAQKTNDVVVLGFEAADPGRYGRLIVENGSLQKIVEFKDANDTERAVTLCNSGVICADRAVLFDLISKVGNDNASGEYYLTDIVGIAREKGLTATAVSCPESETQGINSRAELAVAERSFQEETRAGLLDMGVTMTAPETVFFAYDTVVGRDAIIEPNVVFGPDVTIESNAAIRAFSHLEGCHVARDAVVGPYARLRPGAELSEGVKVGNFCEVKNAVIAEGAKVNHLSYIGDADIGRDSNIGAGTITCNYDGVFKHKTTIGERAFIGSNTMLVAPVTIEDEAMTASGSVITKDVPAESLAIARGAQVVKEGLAKRMMDRLRALKAKQKKDNS